MDASRSSNDFCMLAASDHGTRPMDQQSAQVAVPPLGNTQLPNPSACAGLAGY